MKKIEIYTEGKIERNLELLEKHPPLMRYTDNGNNYICVNEEQGFSSPEQLTIEDITDNNILVSHERGLIESLNSWYGFTPESKIKDFLTIFLSNQNRRDLLISSLLKERIPFYLIAEDFTYDKSAKTFQISTFYVMGYSPILGYQINNGLIKK